ncbi:hypothetical protein D3C78_1902520 [compost metagenome]
MAQGVTEPLHLQPRAFSEVMICNGICTRCRTGSKSGVVCSSTSESTSAAASNRGWESITTLIKP